MKFLPLIYKNILRNKRRTLLTLLSLAFSLFLFVFLFTILSSMQNAMYKDNIQNNITVMSTTYTTTNSDLPESYISKIKTIPHVQAVSPCLMPFCYFKESAEVIVAWGLDLTIIKDFREIGNISNDSLNNIVNERMAGLAGENIMNRYGWQLGDRIILKSTVKGIEIPFTIRGVMSAYGDGANVVYLNLSYVQDLMGNPGRLSRISVKVDDASLIPEISRKIEAMLRNYPVEVLTFTERSFMDSIVEQIRAILIAFKIIGWITIISTFFIVINSLAMSIRERTTEIGIMRTLGFNKAKIAIMFIAESIVVAVTGGILGSFLAYTLITLRHINIPTSYFPLKLIPNVNLVWYGLLISILIGFLASIFPVFSSIRIKISDAVRNVA